ncbi:hypothetical protein ACG83_11070 [Frankia sp. R43]|uniref:recombination directionality factor n=1 Tax=Frankia sp. R43 TaxID=269536 RepID=UPI0006CA5DAC|nr:hypothetical protein [Frankia sp. R43]KPM55805.1 hypothetical protein ACG83_11070 [Frankia sp. R43]
MAILLPEILNMQQRGVLEGQLRIGTSKPGKNGGKQPVKLKTWRITSPSKKSVEAAAAKFGGEVVRWDADQGLQWEVITPLEALPVDFGGVSGAVDQWMTHFDQGILMRRCTGGEGAVNEVSRRPCECQAADRLLCKPETQLLVRFLDLRGIGWWRFTSRGKFVAAGFPVKANWLRNAAAELRKRAEKEGKGGDWFLPAKLVIREMKLPPKTPGGPGRRFPVVDIDIDASVLQIMMGEGGGTIQELAAVRQQERLALTAGTSAGPAALPAGSGGAASVLASAPANAVPEQQAAPLPPRQVSRPAQQARPAAPPADDAERARQAAEWARRPDITRQKVLDFLEKNKANPAMDEFLPSEGDEPASTLRDFLGDRLQELSEGVKERPDGWDEELGMAVPVDAGVSPEEMEQLAAQASP